ncbi:sensor histidine kinase [Algoriphagus lutimaris]|uniref:sensor histidine kinase n=1 Tax=Algoriphagus lutimaris TaxID=613197 RepID=UPI001FAF1031|nr:ATP-binding protein [Algoriphagus lutimaris]
MKKLIQTPFFLLLQFCGLAMISLALNAQNISQNAVFNNITSDEGLPSTSVTDVTQDTYGFIYLGTWEGVFQFDGKNYKKIFYEGRYVEADEKGGVWIEAGDGDLIYYDSNKDSLSFYRDIDLNRRYVQVLLGKQGEVFASTTKGIMKLDPETQKFILEPGQESGEVYNLQLGDDGRVNFILVQNGKEAKMGKRHPDGKFHYEQFPLDENTINKTSFATYRQTVILPYGNSGTVLLNPIGLATRESDTEPWTFKKFSEPELLKEKGLGSEASYIIHGPFIWLNQRNAITKINLETGESLTIHSGTNTHKELLPMSSDHGCKLYLDRQGVIWITRFAYGISLLNTHQSDFGLLRDEQGKTIPDILSSYELEDGSFWIGQRISIESGLIHFATDGKNILHRIGASQDNPPAGKTFGSELSHPYPWAIAETSDSTLWVGTGSPGDQNGGLNRIDPKTGLITRYRNNPKDSTSLSKNWIFGIQVDARDKLWISHTDGMDFFDPEIEKFTSLVKDSSNSRPRGVLIDSQENLLVQRTEDGGSWMLIDTKSKSVIKQGAFFGEYLGYSTSRPVLDTKGRVWIATVDGFGYADEEYNGLKFWQSYEEFGFPDLEIRAFSYDEDGYLYFGTSDGIFQYLPETGKTVRFGIERGLQSSSFNSKLKNRGPSGKIYFSGNGGMNVFDPSELQTNPYPPQIIIRGITLDGKNYQNYLDSTERKPNHTISSLLIPPGITTLNINFAAIHFGGNGNNSSQYRLTNFDDTWQEASGNAVFTNLPAGDYTLELKSVNLDGIWSESPLRVSIKVLPPWYQTWWAYLLYLVLFMILAYLFIQEQRKRAARIEREKSKDRELAQAKEIEKAYSELKSTQAQLIQSEKMASLGELTAGIAHEIQNPLNFVNNFSEVSSEMIDELQEELQNGELEEAKLLATEIKGNLNKITHHGKRADSIVKGMLEHSRSKKGEKELTDINALVDEFVRLSYHGLRAKNKSFNADFKLDLDPNLPKVNVVASDIGRVILNLVNNAFYAVNEKANSKNTDPDYKPLVTVSSIYSPQAGGQGLSRDIGRGAIQISVNDNGSGIPDSIKEKIFQPFFTTKPTGSGTGLGLSLSYDIVKVHGGDLRVRSVDEEGTEMILLLPVTDQIKNE